MVFYNRIEELWSWLRAKLCCISRMNKELLVPRLVLAATFWVWNCSRLLLHAPFPCNDTYERWFVFRSNLPNARAAFSAHVGLLGQNCTADLSTCVDCVVRAGKLMLRATLVLDSTQHWTHWFHGWRTQLSGGTKTPTRYSIECNLKQLQIKESKKRWQMWTKNEVLLWSPAIGWIHASKTQRSQQ